MSPFDFVPLRFEDADAFLLELFDEDPALVDVEVLAFDRDVELVDLVRDEDDPAFADMEPVPLRAVDVFDFADAPFPDLEPDALPAVVLFFAIDVGEDFFFEGEEVDLELEADLDLDPDDEDFDFEVGDFDPADLEADDFEELDLEVEDFLVVAMIFLRVIE